MGFEGQHTDTKPGARRARQSASTKGVCAQYVEPKIDQARRRMYAVDCGIQRGEFDGVKGLDGGGEEG